MILYQFELALTPPSILFSLRTVWQFLPPPPPPRPFLADVYDAHLFSTKLPVLLCVHPLIFQVYET